jgi:D-hexose-6-phosphate mutarotase
MEWDAHDRVESPDIAFQDFSCATQAHTFSASGVSVCGAIPRRIKPGQLNLTLRVTNNDSNTLQFTGALHTYLAVDDIALTELRGFGWFT